MPCNVEAFRAAFLPGVDLPLPLGGAWVLKALGSDNLRAAVDFIVENERAQSVIVYAERKMDGVHSFLSTRHLNVSYYQVDDSHDAVQVAEMVRALGRLLERNEAAVSKADLLHVFAI